MTSYVEAVKFMMLQVSSCEKAELQGWQADYLTSGLNLLQLIQASGEKRCTLQIPPISPEKRMIISPISGSE